MWTFLHVLQALGLKASVQNTPFEDVEIKGFSFNSQDLQPQQAFIALEGAKQDGHQYLSQVREKDASLLVVQKDKEALVPAGSSYVLVPSTYQALNQLGTWARQQSDKTRVVAITGSAGKTTTKNWLNQLLSSVGSTVASVASYNNHTGVPLSLTDLIVKPDFGVFEVGMNHTGEISPLAKMIQPHACIVTTIGAAHIGYLGSEEMIASEKAAIQDGLVEGGVAILPFDSPYFEKLQKPGVPVLSFGEKEGADVRLLSYTEKQGKAHIEVDALGRYASYVLPFVGKHYAHNILAILALAEHWGLKDLPLHTLKLSPQRGEIYTCRTASGTTICVMDDSYNANPLSMKAALSAFASLPSKGRRIAILGEMLELGALSKQAHRSLIEPLRVAKVDHVYAVGSGCLPLIEVWDDSKTCTYVSKAADLVEPLMKYLRDDDVVFVKGSNSSGVRHIMSWLLCHKAA